MRGAAARRPLAVSRDGRQRRARSRRRWLYSNVVFAGAVLVWLFNSLAAVIRGTGNMAVPAVVTVRRRGAAGSAVAAADLRLGPVSGARASPAARWRSLFTTCWAAPALVGVSARPAAACSAASLAQRFRWPLFRDILRVGLVGGAVTVATNLRSASRPRSSGAVRPGRHRRLRHGLAAGIPAGAAGVRARRAAGRDGRHLHRRRPARAGAARHLGRRGDRRRC